MPLRPLIFSLSILAATGAFAQEGFLGQMGEPIDTSQPIEVAADTLEVIQSEQVAVFSGSVDAIQGDMRLQADLLRVHYASGSGSSGDITRLDAVGNVHVSSARETARGDNAVYNVLAEEVTMNGNVVLTQGGNVIQGDSLTIDLASGHSRIQGGDSMITGEGGDGRVRGVFSIPRDQSAGETAEEPATQDSAEAAVPELAETTVSTDVGSSDQDPALEGAQGGEQMDNPPAEIPSEETEN